MTAFMASVLTSGNTVAAGAVAFMTAAPVTTVAAVTLADAGLGYCGHEAINRGLDAIRGT